PTFQSPKHRLLSGLLVPITGDAIPGLEPFDDLFTTFLAEHKIPGASVCISRDGEIVYQRGFGWADVETKAAVLPESLFRIASVSKPITAVAVLQLIEDGRLRLDDNPFEILGHGKTLAGDAVDPRLRDITIMHLLRHTAGFDRGASFDPMFQYQRISRAMNVPSPPGHSAIIEFMLTQPLDLEPGTKHVYSNFGYCMLGRVIEKVSGQTYEHYVQQHVLKPVGVTNMRIGLSLPESRATSEVVYYDQRAREGRPAHDPGLTVPLPYVIDHEVMDSHGGWIATAGDLVKFADAFNDRAHSPLLSKTMIERMFEPPAGHIRHDEQGNVRAAFYGCGWSVRPAGNSANTWHMGLINGTSTLLVRRHDGLNWAVLFNCDRSATKNEVAASMIDSLMHRAAAEVKSWPDSKSDRR
ncbi:MAG: serine hydrolase domain-containing protein, partial [Phycisphaerales bacterium]